MTMNLLKLFVHRTAVKIIKNYNRIISSPIEMNRDQYSKNSRSTVESSRIPMKIIKNPFNMNERPC